MRGDGIVLAAALTALSASSAKADEWCGHTTAADCENYVGKRGVCFIDPDLALGNKHATPLPRHLDAAPRLPRQNG